VRKYLTELIGTFLFVFVICASLLAGSPLAPFAIGLALATMVYAGGHISGGHYNPAVTLAVFLRGRMNQADVLPYMGAQLVGAAVAAGVARLAVNAHPVAFHISGGDLFRALLAELVLTFALAFVVLNVATSKDHPDNSFYGLAIGSTVLIGVIAVGSVSGGVFNPAVALGVSLAGLVSWSMIWIYLIANFAGGAAAAYAFRYLNPSDLAPERAAASR
jgi:aquaporin Z